MDIHNCGLLIIIVKLFLLTSSKLHFSDVEYFPVSDAKRVWVVAVVRKLRAFPVFVVRFEYVEEKTAAPNSLCG